MSIINKAIKKYLHSKFAPDFLFSMYFERSTAKSKGKLMKKLSNHVSLIDNLNGGQKKYWTDRINNVLKSPDNKNIPRVADAGQIKEDKIIMHNGIKIDPLSYYSLPFLKMFIDNKGVHEPQEEKAFMEVLQSLGDKGDKTMLELGAYWSFYSIWFQKQFPSAKCYMIEPDRKNLFFGKRNLKINQQKGTFIHAGIGKQVDKKLNITTVDTICKKHAIEFIDILHSDIQGYELEMLEGSKKMLSEGKVGYAFISTHSNELHQQCYEKLRDDYGFSLVASANLDESFSWDGVLVMKNPAYLGIEKVNISKR